MTSSNRPIFGTNNIAFELPDLTIVIPTKSGTFQLEAYKSVSNDKVLQDNDKNKQSQLLWFSAGHIKLQFDEISDNEMKTIFHKNSEGYHVFVQTLTEYQQKKLAETASRKYNVTISQEQIVNLIFSEFYCTIRLIDENGQVTIIEGEVSNFYEYPLKVNFFIPPKSKELSLFKNKLKSMQENKQFDLTLQCSMTSGGRNVKNNILTISHKDFEQLKIVEKLFGSSNKTKEEVFVTRNQLVNLSGEIYSSMKIVEDYDVSESQFTQDFIKELLQTMSTSVNPVSFDEALQKMSKYSMDYSSDLKSDEIKGELSNKNDTKNKTHIVLNKDFMNKSHERNSSSNEASGNYGSGLFNISGSVKNAQENEQDWAESEKSIDDQLRDLNSTTEDDVKWEMEDTRIVPKFLNVAKLVRRNFTKTLVFKRIQRKYNDAPYFKEISIYHNHLDNKFINQFEDLKEKSEQMETAFKEEINQLRSELGKSNEEIKANLSKLQSETPPFLMRPTEEMKRISKMIKSEHDVPKLCDIWGKYHSVPYATSSMASNWSNVKKKNSAFCVSWNPLMLPTELGGWAVRMSIKWYHNKLSMFGGLRRNDKHNEKAPLNLNLFVRFRIKILFDKFPSLKTSEKTGTTFKLTDQENDNYLWTLSGTVDKKWPVPVLKVKVLKS